MADVKVAMLAGETARKMDMVKAGLWAILRVGLTVVSLVES